MEKLETGIDILDSRLNGGLPTGSVVAFISNPMAMSELFLYELAATRTTHYFTTSRSPESIEGSLESLGEESDNINFVDVGSVDDYKAEFINEHLNEVEPEENIIFDTFSDMTHNQKDRYVEVLNNIYETNQENGGITYLYMVKGNDDPFTHEENKVIHVADVIFRIVFNISGEQVENRLAIPKLRGGSPPDQTIKLKIGRTVTIDTSRDIA